MVPSHLKTPLVIAGPTACGKSRLAIRLAKKFSGEIICADSRQFYRYMAVGTASPKEKELKEVAHHGYQLLDPLTQKIDAGFFIAFCNKKIAEIQKRNKRPIIVGGTGLYLKALRYGLSDVPVSCEKITKMLDLRLKKSGAAKLYEELKGIDPDSTTTIKANDHYRIMRALEIFYLTKKPPSKLKHSFNNKIPKLNAHWLYLKPKKNIVINQIESRVVKMFENSFLDETKFLRKYLPCDHWALNVMGYHEAVLYLDKKITIHQAIQKIIIRHRQLAKRQFTWFNKDDFYKLQISDLRKR